jgi:hypothetical protein
MNILTEKFLELKRRTSIGRYTLSVLEEDQALMEMLGKTIGDYLTLEYVLGSIFNTREFYKARIYDTNDVFDFGKYNGQTLISVIKSNPNYVIWCVLEVNRFFVSNDVLKALAENISKKFSTKESVEKPFDLILEKLQKELKIKVHNPEKFDEVWEQIREERLQEEKTSKIYKEIISGGYADDDITGGEMDFDSWWEIHR